MSMEGELWHLVEAKRDDGTPTMFRIRELPPQKDLTRIFVVELPYSTTEMSRLPNAAAYRRLGELEERWLRPACQSLGWELVGSKTEDGSFFLYMYGAGDPQELVARLSPFDADLGFYDDTDPDWLEYATLRELLEQAKAMGVMDGAKTTSPIKKPDGTKPAARPAKSAKPNAASRKPVTKAPKKAAPKKAALKKAALKKAAPKKPAKANGKKRR